MIFGFSTDGREVAPRGLAPGTPKSEPMTRRSQSVLAAACLVILVARPALEAQLPPPGVSLKITNETAPPGGTVQAKLFVTEPTPISTASAGFSFSGVESLSGVAVMSATGDALGVAVVKGTRLTLSVLSPSGTLGMDPGYPVVTITGRGSATTPLGTTFVLDMDAAALQFTDASGGIYPASLKPGLLLVAPNVNVDDVTPGSGDLAAGVVVTVVGSGFLPTTKVKIKDVLLSDLTYVDASHMQVTVAQPAHMHGAGIQVVNKDGTQTKYSAYRRTAPHATSVNPTLHDAVPVFPDLDVTSAVMDVRGLTTGLALQNRQEVAARISAELIDANGGRIAAASFDVLPSRYLLLELSEVFGMPYSPSQTVRVQSVVPVQVMGVAVDAAGGATPISVR